MAAPHLIIIKIMGRRDLQAAGAELAIDILVGDDRYQTIAQRQLHHAPYQVGVAFVLRVDGHRTVAQHGFRTRGGDSQVALGASQRIVEVPEMALLLFGDYLQVGDRGVQRRIPVDQALAAVNQTLMVQANKHFLHRGAESRIHGEALARPVQGGAQAPQLACDSTAGLFLPLPDFFDKFFATQVMATDALCFQLSLHHHLRGDAGVICAYLPQGVVTQHTVVTDQRVHDRFLKTVPHVQAAGDVGRWDHDAVGLLSALRSEISFGLPLLVPASFNFGGLERFIHNCVNPEVS